VFIIISVPDTNFGLGIALLNIKTKIKKILHVELLTVHSEINK